MQFYPIITPIIIVPVAIATIVLLVVCIVYKKWRKLGHIRRLIMILIMCLILARPTITFGASESMSTNVNIYFVVDATASMNAKDGTASKDTERYKLVQNDIRDIVNSFPGSRYTMIIGDNQIYTGLPMTPSSDAVLGALSLARPKKYNYAQGTHLSELVEYSATRIKSYSKQYPERINLYFFMSDGEDSESSINPAVTFKNQISGGAVFGYGSEKGSIVNKREMSEKNETECIKPNYGDKSIKTDTSGCVISHLNEDNLTKLAKKLDLQYYHRDGSSLTGELIDDIRDAIVYTPENVTNSHTDIYWVFGIILIGILFWEFSDNLNKVLQEKEFKNA